MDSNEQCECHKCIDNFNIMGGDLFGIALPLSATKMILCSMCGNKRCPKASDHQLDCTNSNKVGQAGSIYSYPEAG